MEEATNTVGGGSVVPATTGEVDHVAQFSLVQLKEALGLLGCDRTGKTEVIRVRLNEAIVHKKVNVAELMRHMTTVKNVIEEEVEAEDVIQQRTNGDDGGKSGEGPTARKTSLADKSNPLSEKPSSRRGGTSVGSRVSVRTTDSRRQAQAEWAASKIRAEKNKVLRELEEAEEEREMREDIERKRRVRRIEAVRDDWEMKEKEARVLGWEEDYVKHANSSQAGVDSQVSEDNEEQVVKLMHGLNVCGQSYNKAVDERVNEWVEKSRGCLARRNEHSQPRVQRETWDGGVKRGYDCEGEREQGRVRRDEVEEEFGRGERRKHMPTAQCATENQLTMAQLCMRARIPAVEPEIFDGKAASFPLFRQDMHLMWAGLGMNEGEKLRCLYKYTKGEVRELVQACLYMPPEDGLREAITMLEERYGRSEVVSHEYVEELLKFPAMARQVPKEVDRFYKAMLLAQSALRGTSGGMQVLDNVHNLGVLVGKLPAPLREAWRRKVGDVRAKGGDVTFVTLVEFVKKIARDSNDPVFGEERIKTLMPNSGAVVPVKEQGRSRVMAVGTGADGEVAQPERSTREVTTTGARAGGGKQRCLECKGGHLVDNCNKFRRLDNEVKKERLSSWHRCFACLQYGHMARVCENRKTCDRCGGRHHTAMHRWENPESHGRGSPSRGGRMRGNWRRESGSERERREGVGVVESVGGSAVGCAQGHRGGALSVVPVVVRGHAVWIQSGAFLDAGSAVSFITSRLAERLGGNCEQAHTLEVVTISGNSSLRCGVLYGVEVVAEEDGEVVQLPPLYVVERLPVEVGGSAGGLSGQLPHLRDLPQYQVEEVDLMLGADVPAVLEPLEVRRAPAAGQPFAWRSRLGWIVCAGGHAGLERTVVSRVVVEDVKELREQVKQVFEVGFESAAVEVHGKSVEDRRWEEIVEAGCRMVEGRYEIPLPFRKEEAKMPHSRSVAKKRVLALRRKLDADEEYKKQYVGVIKEMVDEGYCERVEERVADERKVWYIPHFGVRSPTKTRVVFDCAARCQGVCLNDVLLQGPDVNNQLWDVLMRFREGPVAYIADVKAMYYQIRVPQKQRDYMRFWWWSNTDLKGDPEEYRMRVHVFGAVSSPSIAVYALRRTARESAWCSDGVRNVVHKNFYVDDCLRSCENVKKAKHELQDVTRVCADGGFKLHKFVTNSAGVVPEVQPVEDSRALGVKWKVTDDTLAVGWTGADSFNKPRTRRGLLSRVASIFDPLGIIGPTVLRGRLLFQKSYQVGGEDGWESGLDEEVCRELNKWEGTLEGVEDVCVPRNALFKGERWQLHIFADASNVGHAAVAYGRAIEGDMVTFLAGKCRVNSLKPTSVPRLELVAAVLAVKVRMWIERSVVTRFAQTFMWTDSMAVLGYIRNERERYKVFEANRVQYIRDNTDVTEWRYVDTESNPADDGSRGCQSARWSSGPSFLLDGEDQWPSEPDVCQERRVVENIEVCGRVHMPTDGWRVATRFLHAASDWVVLKRRLVWWWRFVKWRGGQGLKGGLTVMELEAAERAIVRFVQLQSYEEEMMTLSAGGEVKRTSKLAALKPRLRDGVMCVQGRLREAPGELLAKEPWILPSEGHVVDLIVRWYHAKVGHMGVWAVLTEMRQKVWVVHGVSTVRKVVKRCVVCRKVKGKPMRQEMADLPVERVTPAVKAFEITGVDCFGPLEVKFGRGRARVKRWVALFTCLAIRAVHLEVLSDMSASAMLNAIRRFVSRRGHVRKFVSDNGTNLVGARKDLVQTLLNKKVTGECVSSGIEWEFITPGSPHFGGVWERLVGVVKRIMWSLWSGHVFTDETLATCLCEAEAVVNGRPITMVSSDPSDFAPLTPARLLLLDDVYQSMGQEAEVVSVGMKAWQRVQCLANGFWRRWVKEYLSMLHGRQKWRNQSPNVEVGDVVLVQEVNLPRGHWPLGRIVEVRPGSDGLVRKVRVRVGGKEYDRSIHKLVSVLELVNDREEE